ncbi:MAG: hypothetical protein V4487_04550 [Chlamydiota bacterium]
MTNIANNLVNYVKSYLPTSEEAALGPSSVVPLKSTSRINISNPAQLGRLCQDAVRNSSCTFTKVGINPHYSSPCLLVNRLVRLRNRIIAAPQRCRTQDELRVEMVQQKLKKEIFKRLPQTLKQDILKESTKGAISSEQIALLQTSPSKWKDLEIIRKIAIRSCLEGKISEKELGYIMLYSMAKEMQDKIPGVRFISTYGQPKDVLIKILSPFCRAANIPPEILGNPSLREDAFLVVEMNKPLNAETAYHYTAMLSQALYPFMMRNQETDQKKIYVFSPHIYEKLLAHTYPNHEKPIFALGTRRVETFSDNTQRILSMTGGAMVPTPNIEANEALSLPFYLHDCYHLDIDSAIGSDRVFWNAFGKHLLAYFKEVKDPNMKEAFRSLADFCLDKEFQSYKQMPKNMAFLVPLIGLYTVAGKHATDNKDDQFQLIKDQSFVHEVRQEFLTQLKTFWNKHAPQLSLRSDLTKQELLKVLPALKNILSKQGDEFPLELEQCLRSN